MGQRVGGWSPMGGLRLLGVCFCLRFLYLLDLVPLVLRSSFRTPLVVSELWIFVVDFFLELQTWRHSCLFAICLWVLVARMGLLSSGYRSVLLPVIPNLWMAVMPTSSVLSWPHTSKFYWFNCQSTSLLSTFIPIILDWFSITSIGSCNNLLTGLFAAGILSTAVKVVLLN